MEVMRAFVIKEPGGPEKLELREVPRPTPRDGWVLIRNRAFGLNRSEWFTRRGESPSVEFPRVLGIECVGEVVAAPGCDLAAGQRVAAMMGGMGRQFDGSYAEYVLVPQQHVFPLKTNLDWRILGALQASSESNLSGASWCQFHTAGRGSSPGKARYRAMFEQGTRFLKSLSRKRVWVRIPAPA